MMHTKLAGHLPLQDLIANIIGGARAKVAAAEEPKDEKKDEKVKKLLKYEKKEHGHIPTPKEEESEKKASVIDASDPDEVEKLASALESVADQLVKEADKVDNGGEKKQGGEQLAVMTPVGGKQSYKKDSSKSHNVPMKTGLEKGDANVAATQVPNDHAKAPGGAPYPKKGVMKTASEGVMAKIQAAVQKPALEKEAEFPPKKEEKKDEGEKKPNPFAAKADKKDEKKDDKKDEEKKASAEESPVDFILGKLSSVYNGKESKQGGEQLANKAPVPSNPGREMISSNAAATNAKKVQAKAPQKKLLSQVLTEPALSKSTDSKVHENLRNATKGGVKIAAARALLQKIAEAGCTCSGKGDCKYCKMKAAKSKMEKDSNATGASYGASMPGMPTAPKPAM